MKDINLNNADIDLYFEKRYTDEFFATLDIAGDAAIHKWIDKKTMEFFKERKDNDGSMG